MVSQVLGGIGLFLIGMVLATDGLRAAAGDALRRLLLRFTGGPFQALASGALVTALVQSSSATTVATIGFVTAGLLSFHQALGLILGANIGTTATGWIVALLGLKFSVSTIALPAVGVGALVRLFGRGRWKQIGLAIAGFGTLFVGLDVLQAGMQDLNQYVTPETLPSDTWLGRTALVGIGFAMTAVMQSSSAGVATALAALHAGTISMMQAAAMVIGINVGTTVTAVISAVGGSTAARRTAVAHLAFNIATGLIAFATLPIFVQVVLAVGETVEANDATLALAGFHTAFNLLGVALVLPFIRQFARLVERVVPSREPDLTRHLARSLTDQGGLAIEAARLTVFEIAHTVVSTLYDAILRDALTDEAITRLDVAHAAVQQTHDFIASIRNLEHVGEHAQARHVATVHALDRIEHLILVGRNEMPAILSSAEPLPALVQAGLPLFEATLGWLENPEEPNPVEFLETKSRELAETRRRVRQELLEATGRGDVTPNQASQAIDGIRHLDQLVYYLWRLANNLRGERKLQTG